MSNCSVWTFERNVGFIDKLLFDSFTDKNVQAKNSYISLYLQVSL